MTTLDELHGLLTGMMDAIAARDNGVAIADQLHRIDRIRDELGDEAPPMLQHYLEKRSYAKALEFLRGNDETEKPNC